jgi:hypothetical protein
MKSPRTRPTRVEFVHHFFSNHGGGSIADNEASLKYNTLACDAILADQINLFDAGFSAQGPGVLVNRLAKKAGPSGYMTLDEIHADKDLAIAEGDTAIAASLAEIALKLTELNTEKYVPILLLDGSRLELLIITRDQPARAILAMLEEYKP